MAIQALRRGSRSWVVKGILILIAISFAAFFGVSDNPFQRTTRLITVGDGDVGADEIATAFNREIQAMAQLFGGDVTTGEAVRLGLLDRAIDTIVERHVARLGARDAGVVVGETQVRDAIVANPDFRAAGAFDRLLYESFLLRSGLGEAGYIEALRQQLAQEQFFGSVSAGRNAPAPLLESVYRHREERRSADFTIIADAAMADPGTPDEATLAAFHEAEQARFMAPEYRALTIAALSPEELSLDISVAPGDVEAAYELRRASYGTPERRTVAQALFEDGDAARRAAGLVSGGRGFADAVEEVSGAAPLDLGEVTRSDLIGDAVAAAVFDAGPETVTAPVEGPFGWALYRVGTVVPATTRTLEEVREELAAELALERARDDIFEVMNAVDDALAGGAALEEAAQAGAVPVVTAAAVAADGTGRDGTRVGGIVSEAGVLAAAFDAAADVDSTVTETPGGGFFVVRVDGITEAAPQPLADVRAEAVAAWQAARRREAALELAAALAGRLEAGGDPAALAAEHDLAIDSSPAFLRDGTDSGEALPGDAVAALFAAARDDAVTVETDDGVIVALLRDIDRPAAAEGEAGDRLRESLAAGLANDLAAQLGAALREDYGVAVNRTAIDSLLSLN